MSSTAAKDGDSVKVLSPIIVAQSDVRDKEYLISWLKKGKLLFE